MEKAFMAFVTAAVLGTGVVLSAEQAQEIEREVLVQVAEIVEHREALEAILAEVQGGIK